MKEEEVMQLTEGTEMKEGENIGIIICILPYNCFDCYQKPRIIEIYGNAKQGEDINESGVYELAGWEERITEMERRGYKLLIRAYVVFPPSHRHGSWEEPHIIDINRNNPYIWEKDGKVWIDTEGLTT